MQEYHASRLSALYSNHINHLAEVSSERTILSPFTKEYRGLAS